MSGIPYTGLEVLGAQLLAEEETITLRCLRAIEEHLALKEKEPQQEVGQEGWGRAHLLSSIRGQVRLILTQLTGQQTKDNPSPLEPIRIKGSQGLGLRGSLEAGQIIFTQIHRSLQGLIISQHLPEEEQLILQEKLWDLKDSYLNSLLKNQGQEAGCQKKLRQEAKGRFLQALEAQGQGAKKKKALLESAKDLRLDPEASYQLACTRLPGQLLENWQEITEDLEERASCPHLAATALLAEGEELILLTSGAQKIQNLLGPYPQLATWALAPPSRLEKLPQALGRARQVGRSIPAGQQGLFSLETLSWKLAVGQQPEIGRYLQKKYWASLSEGKEGVDSLLACLWAYLEEGRNYRRAAEKLYIHENTLRNKISSCQELTGLNLSSPEVGLELAWLKHYLALGPLEN
ncbi:MAG: helix-turn-helix domain-containing protein [Rothia sp. (in: high G+C Gram-positive bacteria)]|nr:helix-turn-helix domain-containing protein [Rothia sp. (in: high G+C Gram-positive bacteria)]